MNVVNEWDVDLKTRREISYLQAAACIIYHLHLHVSFTCINSPSLTRKVDFIKEWNKGIDNCLRSQDENICWITTKTNNGPNFQYRKLSVINLVLTDGRNLSGSRLKSAYGKSFFVFWFSSLPCKVWTSAAINRKNSTKDLGLGIVKALPFVHQPDEGVRKRNDVSAADWWYQTHVKKIRIFSGVLLRLFLELEILL